jgi:hypothetical protein
MTRENYARAWNAGVCDVDTGNCLVAAVDTLSKNELPFWLYAYYEAMYDLNQSSLLSEDDGKEVWRIVLEAGGFSLEDLKQYRVTTKEQMERILKDCWENGGKVIMEETNSKHVVALSSYDGCRWYMMGIERMDLSGEEMLPAVVFKYLARPSSDHGNVYVIEDNI